MPILAAIQSATPTPPERLTFLALPVAAAIGTVAPGWFSVGKSAINSGRAISKLSEQLGRAQTINRAAKIAGRIQSHTSSIAGDIVTQGAFQGAKYVGKQVTGAARTTDWSHQADARALLTDAGCYRLISEMPWAPATALVHEVTVVATVEALAQVADALGKVAEVGLSPRFEGAAHSAPLLGLGVKTADACWYLDVPALGAAAMKAVLGPVFAREGLTPRSPTTARNCCISCTRWASRCFRSTTSS